MKRLFRNLLKICMADIGALVLGTVIGIAALLLADCVPECYMYYNLLNSMDMLENEFVDGVLVDGYNGTMTGNFTDCLMLENAVYHSPNHSGIEQMIFMYRGEHGDVGWAPGYSLSDYVNDVPFTREVEYARYWHGYLVFLKPLLFLTTVNGMRMLASVLQFVLAGAVCALCVRRKEVFLGMAYFLSLPFLYFFTMSFSLSLSICFYIVSFLLIIQLLWHEYWKEKNRYLWFFLAGGMLTSYFDFLTYPLVTLGIPLCVCLYLLEDKAGALLKRLFAYSLQWSIGYVGFWVMKWIATDLFWGGDIIATGWNALIERTGSAADESRLTGYIKVLLLNLAPYRNVAYGLLALGIVIWLVMLIFRKIITMADRKNIFTGTSEGAILWLVAGFPLLWFFVAQNHSQEHWMFTFKIFTVSVFAAICGVGKWMKTWRKDNAI